MTQDDLLFRLVASRAVFDAKVGFVPAEAFDSPAPGSKHSTRDIVSHVAAYERLIAERLIAARHGSETALEADMDREDFDETTWREAAGQDRDMVLSSATSAFATLLHEVGSLSEEELNAPRGTTASLDRAWLRGRPPWEAILADSEEHYRAHHGALDAAAGFRTDSASVPASSS